MLIILNDYYLLNLIFFFQRRVYKTTETIPSKLISTLDVETFRKARSYGIDKNSFSIAEEWFNMIFSTVSKKKFEIKSFFLISIISKRSS